LRWIARSGHKKPERKGYMKKAFTLVVLIVTPTMAFAQGSVTLGNQSGLIKQWTSATDPTLISVQKGGGYVQLIAAPVGTSLVNPLFSSASGTLNYSSLSGFLAANPGWLGAWGPNGGTASNPALIAMNNGVISGGTYTINNIGDGADAEYFLISWTGAFTTADAAIAAFNGRQAMFGESAVFTTGTGGAGTPATLPTNLKTTFGGMTMVANAVVPEPATFALAGLGLAALLVFRRRS
jgi:hypothetical protein